MSDAIQYQDSEAFYIRPSATTPNAMDGIVSIRGMKCLVTLTAGEGQGDIVVHKIKVDGSPSAKPVATGFVRQNNSRTAKAPNLTGFITSASGNDLRISMWFRENPGDSFYVFKYTDLPPKVGKVLKPGMFK